MPAVVKGRRARAKLFDTLNQTGSHFIAVGSGSGSESESDRRSSSGSDRNLPTEEESGQLVLGRASTTTDEGGERLILCFKLCVQCVADIALYGMVECTCVFALLSVGDLSALNIAVIIVT